MTKKGRHNKNKKKEPVSSLATESQVKDLTLATVLSPPTANESRETQPQQLSELDNLSHPGVSTRAMEAGKRQLENGENGGNDSQVQDPAASPSRKQAKTDNENNQPQDIFSGDPPTNQQLGEDPNADKWTWLINKLNSIENNTAIRTKDVDDLKSTTAAHSKQIQETKSSLLSHKRKMEDIAEKQDTLLSKVNEAIGEQLDAFKTSLQQENELFKAELVNLTNKKVDNAVSGIKEEVMESKSEARNRNLIVMGLSEEGNEESDLKAAKDLFTQKMGLSNIDLDQIVRLGKEGGAAPRPALVTFQFLSQRNKAWFAKSKLKKISEEDHSKQIWLQEDVPKPIKIAQKALYQTFKRAKSMKDTFTSVQLKGTKLIIDGNAYSHLDMENLPPPLRPASLATRQSESAVIFFGRASPLSNHHHSPFLLDDHHFACVEQYLAWSRAELAGNETLSSKALSSSNPAICKGILNELHKSDSTKWEEQTEGCIEAALRAKFAQNQKLASFLLDTHPRPLGEASLNKKWGIGFKLTDKLAMDPTKWKEGGNLLGKKLMELREELLLNHLSK